MLPEGVIIPFDGNNSEIPAGFVRDTRFDGKFPLGSSANWGQTGGSATHNHGNMSHTHNIGAHTHSGVTQLAWRGADNTNDVGYADLISYDHRHNYSGDGHSAGTSGGCSINTTTYSIPEYYEVIFIKAQSKKQIPSGGLVWNTQVDSDRRLHLASNGRFLIGASSGANAGAKGGSFTHSHDVTHTHTANGHTHSITTDRVGGDRAFDANRQNQSVTSSHTHTQTLASSIQNMNSASGVYNATILPYHSAINLYETAGKVKEGDIVITTDSTNPKGWLTCDGTQGTPKLDDRFIRNTSSKTSEIITDGSNSHTHEDWTHGHTGSGTHTHGDGGISNHNVSGSIIGNGTAVAIASLQHDKGGFTCSSTTANYENTTVSCPTADNTPPYIRVRFIMATKDALKKNGATLLLKLM